MLLEQEEQNAEVATYKAFKLWLLRLARAFVDLHYTVIVSG